MKKKIFFLVFAIGGVLLLASFLQSVNHKDLSQTASLEEATSRKNNKPVYSFYQDDDLDRLCNAKETIYGSSADTSDTDGDGYLDGEEVENGYDPIVAGDARLRQRSQLSLSIEYFLWVQEEKGIKDPEISDNLIQEFIEKYPSKTEISYINDEEIKNLSYDDKESIRTYLAEINRIGLPEGIIGYKDISQGFNEDSLPLLEDLLGKIELAYLDFSYLQVPPATKEIQRGYLTIIREFSNIFSDLKFYQQNPVQIEINFQKAKKLIDLSEKTEQRKLELINQYEIS